MHQPNKSTSSGFVSSPNPQRNQFFARSEGVRQKRRGVRRKESRLAEKRTTENRREPEKLAQLRQKLGQKGEARAASPILRMVRPDNPAGCATRRGRRSAGHWPAGFPAVHAADLRPISIRFRMRKGEMPQGGVVSPLLANLYLPWFDRLYHGPPGPARWANAKLSPRCGRSGDPGESVEYRANSFLWLSAGPAHCRSRLVDVTIRWLVEHSEGGGMGIV